MQNIMLTLVTLFRYKRLDFSIKTLLLNYNTIILLKVFVDGSNIVVQHNIQRNQFQIFVGR